MVKTYEQAFKIQVRRKNLALGGIAVAVKRFLKRNPQHKGASLPVL